MLVGVEPPGWITTCWPARGEETTGRNANVPQSKNDGAAGEGLRPAEARTGEILQLDVGIGDGVEGRNVSSLIGSMKVVGGAGGAS